MNQKVILQVLGTIVGTLLLVFGATWLVSAFYSTSPTTNQNLANKQVETADLIAEYSPVLGASPDQAEHTIVVFSDLLCPACATVNPQLESLVKADPEKIRLVYRHFPLISLHPTADLLAEAAQAASAQNKFWEFHDYIFNQQSSFSKLSDQQTKEKLVGAAAEIGLDARQFQQDLENGTYRQQVSDDRRRAELLKLTYTPSIFLDGQLMSFEQVVQAISL